MSKNLAAGKTFLAGVLAKLPEGLRGEATKVFEDATLQAEIGTGVLAQSELSRQLDDLRTKTDELNTKKTELDEREQSLTAWHEQLTGWHATNKTALDEYNRLKKEGKLPGGGGNPDPNANRSVAEGTLTEEKLAEQIKMQNAAFLGFEVDRSRILREHFQRFNEIVDVEPLLRHPQIKEVGLVGVYELVHADRLKKHKEDAEKAAEERIRADERQKVLAANQQMPYPTPTGVGSGSPLDALEANKKEPVVDAAVTEYNRLQQQRHAGAAAR